MHIRFTALVLSLCLLFCLLPPNARAEEVTVEVDKNAILSGLFEADIADIRDAILEGLVTSREVTEYYLNRIKDYNKPYNCFITICDDALSQADARDAQLTKGEAKGLLFGVPIVVKDNIDVEGVHTTNGYKKKDSQIAKDNAAAVQKLIDQGAVILAKTNMSTGAKEAHWSKSEVAGETKNAYNKYYSPGGSSGGSSTAVSLNFAAASLGTDTNSSLRLPAALAGCFALRPTFDLVDRDGVVIYNEVRDVVGSITRSASDLVLMMDVLTGGKYSYAQKHNPNVLKGLRLGVLKELTYPTLLDTKRTEEYIDKEVSAVFANAVAELKACGAEIIEVSFRDIFALSQDKTDAGKERFYKVYLELLSKNNISALIFPTYLSTPLKSGIDENGKYWYVHDESKQVLVNNCRNLSSCVKLPEITIPIGYHSGGPGIGMEIAAPRNCEQLLLDIALAYSAKYDHRVAPAGAPDDYITSSAGSLRDVLNDYYARLEAAKNPPTEPVTEEKGEQPAKWKVPTAAVIVLCICAVCVAGVYVREKRKQKARKRRTNPLAK